MNSKQLAAIFCLNLFGILWFLSWYLPGNQGIWFNIDSAIFYYFNRQLVPGSTYVDLVAIMNNRAFDLVSLLAMGLLYLSFFVKQDRAGKKKMIIIGFVMLLTAVILSQCCRLIPIEHPSPTLTFNDSNRLSRLTSITTKDSSSNSFPGDHGLMLMIYAAFMLRYFTRGAFALGVLFVIIFTLPRIMSGAHWFTDIYVGSLAIACITLSWLLITPAIDWVIKQIDKIIPIS